MSADIAEIISNNQERLLRWEASCGASPGIRNLRSSLDRIFDFMVRAGVIYGDMPEFSEAVARLSPTEIHGGRREDHLPTSPSSALIDDHEQGSPRRIRRPQGARVEFHGRFTTPSSRPSRRRAPSRRRLERVPVFKLIASLNPAQRVALAVRGNREARTIWFVIRTEPWLWAAAIRSPRITEQEIISAAQSRSVADEVVPGHRQQQRRWSGRTW